MKRFPSLLFYISLLMISVSCGGDKKNLQNPLFEQEWDTPYGVPPFDKITNDHFKPAFEQGMSLHNEEIDVIVTSKQEPSFENVILAYDNSGQMLYRVSSIFGMLESADTDEQKQALAAEYMPRMASHYDAIMMNDKLFEKIKSVYERRHALGLDAEQIRLTELIYKDFVRSGALLSSEDKEALKQINEQLSALEVQFGDNQLAATNAYTKSVTGADLTGVPTILRAEAAEKAKQEGKGDEYIFTLQKNSVLAILANANNRALREEIYKAYLARCEAGSEYDNNKIIAQIASLRYRKAKLLGYDSYAHYVIADQMASTPEAVYGLLEQTWEYALAQAKNELEKMQPLLRRDDVEANFESWDWWYYAEKVRQSEYNIEEDNVRQYLSVNNVKGGIFFLANRLYGITFRPIQAPVYHPECEVFEVLDVDETPLGVLYFDLYPRASKGGGAWCGTYIDQSYKDGKRVVPVVSIVCNFTPPADGQPALLSIDETETLFHEFGHALHSLFADVKYRGLANVEGDFVELPSQIMENWAFSSQMLKHYAVHYRTGETMSDSMIANIQRAATFNEGFNTTELVAAALSDMDIHSLQSDAEIDPTQFERQVLNEKRGLIPQIEPRYRYPYFGHIFDGGYSAGYYFYLWAEVLDKDAYRAFVESGDLFDKATAERFRREVLSKGGSRAGMDMYRAFRGAEPDSRAMLVARGLVKDEVQEPESEQPSTYVKVDTREQARQRAERSRREREQARLKADSMASDSLSVEVAEMSE